MDFILLSLSYWLHLLATVVWLGGLAVTVAVALPAVRANQLDDNQWVALQRSLVPWVNGSLIVLLVTGLFQMTRDEHYQGLLVLDGVWAWSLLLKHVAFGALAAVTLYLQLFLYPDMARSQLLAERRPDEAAADRAAGMRREQRLLWANALCAAVILLLTAVMTAV